ncbi:hypothetical protein ACFQ1M_16160 [Sungkyunkwania multivorans]|uniref:Tetratricopeptide repeat protein n=1 Tax=Sungkyunkwania multivorans TaxID=1173618 RepID=A0ABW3D106_9FLAO
MNISDFTYLLQKPEACSSEQVEELEMILKEYPYFQSARAVHLKGLQLTDSFKYNDALKKTAAFTNDRSVLFDFITKKKFKQHKTAEKIKKQDFDINKIKVIAEEVTLSQQQRMEVSLKTKIEEAAAVLDPQLFQPKGEEEALEFEHPLIVEEESQKRALTEATEKAIHSLKYVPLEEKLKLGKPLDFDLSEPHSFNEWLKLSTFKPINRDDERADKEKSDDSSEDFDNAVPEEDSRAEKFAMIDKFISNNPKIVPTKQPSAKTNLAEEYSVEKNALMTETLARVYLEQKKYKKAIQAYEILSLKYPEKSGFFADQIRAIKKLQQYNS